MRQGGPLVVCGFGIRASEGGYWKTYLDLVLILYRRSTRHRVHKYLGYDSAVKQLMSPDSKHR